MMTPEPARSAACMPFDCRMHSVSMLTVKASVDVVLCASELGIAVVSFARMRRAPIGWFLGWFCLCVATWSTCALIYNATLRPTWTLLDHALSPLSAPLALDFALNLDGRRRTMGGVLATAYGLAIALGAVSA